MQCDVNKQLAPPIPVAYLVNALYILTAMYSQSCNSCWNQDVHELNYLKEKSASKH